MAETLTTIAVSVSGSIITAVIFLIGRRFSLKTKTDCQIEALSKNVENLSKGQTVVFKCLLPLLLAQKNGKCNGELDAALDELNNYFLEK